jgi:hypothetical protein
LRFKFFHRHTSSVVKLAEYVRSFLFKFFHRHTSSPPSSSDYHASSSDFKEQEPPEEQRLIIYESLPVYDSENNEFVGKVKIPVEVKLIDTS